MSRSNGSHPVPPDPLSPAADGAGLSISLTAELVEAIAERAAAMLRAEAGAGPEPWLGVGEAAIHLACPTSRIYALVSVRRIPHHRDGSRLLFRRSELDDWVEQGGARRP